MPSAPSGAAVGPPPFPVPSLHKVLLHDAPAECPAPPLSSDSRRVRDAILREHRKPWAKKAHFKSPKERDEARLESQISCIIPLLPSQVRLEMLGGDRGASQIPAHLQVGIGAYGALVYGLEKLGRGMPWCRSSQWTNKNTHARTRARS